MSLEIESSPHTPSQEPHPAFNPDHNSIPNIHNPQKSGRTIFSYVKDNGKELFSSAMLGVRIGRVAAVVFVADNEELPNGVEPLEDQSPQARRDRAAGQVEAYNERLRKAAEEEKTGEKTSGEKSKDTKSTKRKDGKKRKGGSHEKKPKHKK